MQVLLRGNVLILQYIFIFSSSSPFFFSPLHCVVFFLNPFFSLLIFFFFPSPDLVNKNEGALTSLSFIM